MQFTDHHLQIQSRVRQRQKVHVQVASGRVTQRHSLVLVLTLLKIS
jgi:hypothetical protein